MKILEAIKTLLAISIRDKHWGEITLVIQNGVVVRINKIESIKIDADMTN
jgi:hypothetical protein